MSERLVNADRRTPLLRSPDLQDGIPADGRVQTCPLCDAPSIHEFCRDRHRRYFQCARCLLIHADPASRLTPAAEKARYERHQNRPDDPGYRAFLRRLADPLVERLGKGPASGLDFGCGPGPTLSVMLQELGYSMSVYDPFFAPDTSVLRHSYDFVTCTEAIEHFHAPGREWTRLLNLVKPGGWLAIMTRLVTNPDTFAQWHYANDLTHVSFFTRETFHYLAARDRLELERVGDDIMFLRTPVAF